MLLLYLIFREFIFLLDGNIFSYTAAVFQCTWLKAVHMPYVVTYTGDVDSSSKWKDAVG